MILSLKRKRTQQERQDAIPQRERAARDFVAASRGRPSRTASPLLRCTASSAPNSRRSSATSVTASGIRPFGWTPCLGLSPVTSPASGPPAGRRSRSDSSAPPPTYSFPRAARDPRAVSSLPGAGRGAGPYDPARMPPLSPQLRQPRYRQSPVRALSGEVGGREPLRDVTVAQKQQYHDLFSLARPAV